jgi:hypothetical protein
MRIRRRVVQLGFVLVVLLLILLVQLFVAYHLFKQLKQAVKEAIMNTVHYIRQQFSSVRRESPGTPIHGCPSCFQP